MRPLNPESPLGFQLPLVSGWGSTTAVASKVQGFTAQQRDTKLIIKPGQRLDAPWDSVQCIHPPVSSAAWLTARTVAAKLVA